MDTPQRSGIRPRWETPATTAASREGWKIRNETKLPVVCFTRRVADVTTQLLRICARVVNSGEAWISTTLLAGNETVLRACITNYRTNPQHVEDLVAALGRGLGGGTLTW